LTTRREFEAAGLIDGEDIIAYCKKNEEKGQIAGFLDAVDEFGQGQIKVVPILKARSMSGGPVKREVYETFKKTIVDGIKNVGHLDGIYLSLHGAMGVEGLRDPEGDLLESIRAVSGDQIPIGVSHDLHANLTRRRMELMTFLENPGGRHSIYTAFHKYIPDGISGCRKKRSNNGTFF
jgi:microcystin degradation protein MlrC